MKSQIVNSEALPVRLCQTTPKSKHPNESDFYEPPMAPQSLKQGPREEDNNEVLNICCSGFNSLLFLTPPKIRAAKENPTPSPLKPEPNAVAPFESAIPKDLMYVMENDPKENITSPLMQNNSVHPMMALHNITNQMLENKPQNEENDTANLKKKGQKSNFKFPDGGWVCLACQNYNFCGRVRCNRCGKNKTKDDPVGKPKHLLRKENDENDPMCVNKVQAPKTKKQLKERAGDWLCMSCRNINFAFRQQCNRCKMSKELIGTALDQKNPMWQGIIGYPHQMMMATGEYMPQAPQFDYNGYQMVMQKQGMVFPQ